MTTIRVSCPHCGAVDLTPEEVRLRIVGTLERVVGPDSHYAFTCPSCCEQIAKPADQKVADILRSGGVEAEIVDEAAAGLAHPEDPPAGPMLSFDDLIDFHVLLEDDDWFDRLLELSS
jgi:hypothetical protein